MKYIALRAGNLDRSIVIERRSGETIDQYGEPIEVWTALGDFRAEFVESGISESIDGNGAVTRTVEEVTLRIRWIDGLSVRDRIFYDGRRFDITVLAEIPRRRGWQIQAVHRGLA